MLSCAHNSRVGVGCVLQFVSNETGAAKLRKKWQKNMMKQDFLQCKQRFKSYVHSTATKLVRGEENWIFFYNNLGDGELSEMSFNMYI
jgi:hypothetical protein